MDPIDDLAPGGAMTLDRDLAAELRAAEAVPQRTIDVLLSAGVSPGALAFDADGYLNPLHLAPVVFECMGRFEFARYHGRPITDELCRALVWIARDVGGKPLDLVAWSPKRARVATWLGAVPMLGWEQTGWCYDMAAETLPVHDTPEGWLRANRCGVVLFDDHGAAPWLHLSRPLSVPTPIAGTVLRDRLTIPAPRIVVEVAA